MVRPVFRLRSALQDLDAFLVAFDDLTRHLFVEQRPKGTVYIIGPTGDEHQRRRAQVNELAGPAQRAVELADSLHSAPPRVRVFDPEQWERIDGGPREHQQMVRSTVQQARGTLAKEVILLEQRQRGLPGVLAWLISLPSEVRELAGYPARSAAGRLITVGVVMGELALGVVASVLATLLVRTVIG